MIEIALSDLDLALETVELPDHEFTLDGSAGDLPIQGPADFGVPNFSNRIVGLLDLDLLGFPHYGLSAYELALQRGFVGNLDEWLASLRGQNGTNGTQGSVGLPGRDGIDGRDGRDGINGLNGLNGVRGLDGGLTEDAEWLRIQVIHASENAAGSALAAATALFQARSHATDAEVYAAAALTHRTEAEVFRNETGQWAAASAQNRLEAEAFANDSGEHANAANLFRAEAATSRSEAEIFRTQAVTAFTGAQTSAASATDSAGAALESRNAAQDSANAAFLSQSTANTFADEARTEANAARVSRLAASAARDEANLTAAAVILIEQNVTSLVTDAESSATASQTARLAAESARNEALTFRDQASTSASAAFTSAQNAATSSTEAGSSATAANTSRLNAEAAFTSADTARIAAQTSAGAALTHSQTASGHADAAGASSSAANTSALNANSSFTAADGARTAAQLARDAALGYRDAANTYASAALTHSQTAETHADAAGASSVLAETRRLAAETAAGRAELAETNSVTSETNANGARLAAETARDIAIAARDTAGGHATAAAGSASSAQSFADTAGNIYGTLAARTDVVEASMRSLPNLINNGDFSIIDPATSKPKNWAIDNGTFNQAIDQQVGSYASITGVVVSENYNIAAGSVLSISCDGEGPSNPVAYVQWLPSYATGPIATLTPANWEIRHLGDTTTNTLAAQTAPTGTTGFRVVIASASGSFVNISRIKVNIGTRAAMYTNDRDSQSLGARITTVETVTTNGSLASASSVNTLSATLTARGGNLLQNTDFQSGVGLAAQGWYGGGTVNAPVELNPAGDPWRPDGENTMGFQVQGAGGYSDINSSKVSVEVGKYYGASGYVAAHRAQVELYLGFFNEAGTALAYHTTGIIIPGNGGKSLSNYTRMFVKGIAPAGAVSAALIYRKHPTYTGSDSWMWVTRPMLAECSENQGFAPPFEHGNARQMGAEIIETKAVAVDALGKANATVGVTLDVNGYVTGWLQTNNGTTGGMTIVGGFFKLVDPNGGTPFSPFTVVGNQATFNANVQINGNLIVTGTINGGTAIANNTITNTVIQTWTDTIDTVPVGLNGYRSIMSLTITTEGGKVRIDWSSYFYSNNESTSDSSLDIAINRNGGTIFAGSVGTIGASENYPVQYEVATTTNDYITIPGNLKQTITAFLVDHPVAGTYTYEVFMRSPYTHVTAIARSLSLTENKTQR